MIRRSNATIASSLLACALSGCAVHEPLSHVAVEQNDLLATSTDQVMLINILRARNNEPMHFSLVSGLTGSVTLQAGFSLGGMVPTNSTSETTTPPEVTTTTGSTAGTTSSPESIVSILSKGASSFTPSLSGMATTAPSFSVTTYDTQEFYQGFLKPIGPELIAYYIDSGWPRELLTYLLVRRIDFYKIDQNHQDKNGAYVGSLVNDFKNDNNLNFQNYISCFSFSEKGQTSDDDAQTSDNAQPGDSHHAQSDTSAALQAAVAELLPLGQLNNIEKLDGKSFDTKIIGNKRYVVRVPDQPSNLTLAQSGTDTATNCSKIPKRFVDLGFGMGGMPAENSDLFKTSSEIHLQKRTTGSKSFAEFVVADDKGNSTSVAAYVTIRSPESVFYFLGEYLRDHGRNQLNIKLRPELGSAICSEENKNDIFDVEEGEGSGARLSVKFHDKAYFIPIKCSGRSMQVLTLVEQLFDLQIKSSDKLASQTLRLVP